LSVTATELSSPYKGLAPFEDSELDALLFFGRERETEIIVSNLLASKLTVLYGPSGVGKSSIIHAAVVRRLRTVEPDADVVVLDDWAGELSLPEASPETFLILDQFEEYFLYHDVGDGFAEALATSPAHVLISLREDQLAQLDAFQADLPNVFANRLRLAHLDRSAARAAIVGPLDRWNAVVEERVGIETALVDEVLDQVATGPDQVEAPYLQLVLERVWDEEQGSGSHVLRRSALERLGGAQAIVSAHLERALSALPPRDAEIATNALRFLVTPSRTKIAHTLDDLVGYTNESPVVLQRVLELLAAQRVLRAGDGGRYEIFHDVLAEPLLAWRREREARAALAAAHRRHRRLAVIAGASLALAAGMVALTVYAFSQRSEASKQKRVALAQRADAVAAKRHAELQRLRANEERDRATHAKHAAQTSARQALAAEAAARTAEAEAKRNAARARKSEAEANVSAAAAIASEQKAEASKAIAVKERAKAQRSAKAAKQSAAVARRQELRARVGEDVANAEAKLTVDPILSTRSALAASALAASHAIETALRDALTALRVRAIFDAGGPVSSATFSPDGALVATGAGSGFVRLFKTDTHARLRSMSTGSPVTKVVFSPDGKLLAAATQGGRALVYDVGGGTLLQTLRHDGAVLALGFGGGGRYVVTGSADRTLRIWDTASGTLVHAITLSAAVTTIAINPAGTIVVALAQGDPVGRVYDIADGSQVASVQQQGQILVATFNQDGSLLATAGTRNTYLWQVGSWNLFHLLTGHTASITDVAFTGDGQIVSASADSGARLYDVATGTPITELLGQHQQRLTAVAVSPDHSQITTASADRTARIWPQPLGVRPDVLAGHKDAVTSLEYSPDGRLLLTASPDGTARLWDTTEPTFTRLGKHDGAVNSVQFSPDGKLLLSSSQDGSARLWNAGGLVGVLKHRAPVTRAIFVGNDRVLTASEDGTAQLWRAADGMPLQSFAHGSPVRGVAYADGAVVTGGDDATVKAWNANGSLRWSQPNGTLVTDVAASGAVVATAGADGTARLWDLASGRLLHVLTGHTARIADLAFSRDGKLLGTASDDQTGRVWNVATGKLVSTLTGHRFRLTSIVFSPDGDDVLTASVDGDARLWDAATGRALRTLRFHEATVSQAVFSPDGRWIVTAGPADAAIWLRRTGDQLIHIPALTGGPMRAAAFSADNATIAVGLTNGSVVSYRCPVCGTQTQLAAIAKARLKALGSG
jgi:WD40 repeat protein